MIVSVDDEGRNRYNCHMESSGPLPTAERTRLDADQLAELAAKVRAEELRRKDSWRTCQECEARFLARRGARFCSGRCRTAAYRSRAQAVA